MLDAVDLGTDHKEVVEVFGVSLPSIKHGVGSRVVPEHYLAGDVERLLNITP